MFRFYHADRRGALREGMTLELRNGLSPFGEIYWGDILRRCSTGAELGAAAMREFLLEEIRATELPHAVSRMRCFFGTNYLEEAVRFATAIEPVPEKPVAIFEVYAAQFVTLDMSLIDLPPEHPDFPQHRALVLEARDLKQWSALRQ